MSNYVKSVNFESKDSLTTGNPLKIVKGIELNDEFNAIQTAVATKADITSPAFLGNPTATTQSSLDNSTRLATTAFVQTIAGSLGTLSTQDADAVAITGGTITGTTINTNVVGANSVGARTIQAVSAGVPTGGASGDIVYQY